MLHSVYSLTEIQERIEFLQKKRKKNSQKYQRNTKISFTFLICCLRFIPCIIYKEERKQDGREL